MSRDLIIIGASGHGKVIADIAERTGYRQIVFLDDDEEKKECGKYPVTGRVDTADRLNGDVIVAVGNASIRRRIQESIGSDRIATLIHPDAVIAEDVEIGAGTVVMAGAVINPGAKIGKGCIINTCASVDHDCRIGDYVHVSVGAHIAGTVTVEDNTWIGAGATVSNNLEICPDCMIGAGAVVVKDLLSPGTYVGVPAQKIK